MTPDRLSRSGLVCGLPLHARELQRRLPERSKELGLDLRASIGIATGYARVGRLGSDDVKDYTAIGDVVNQAARLQAQARAGEILIAENVYAKVAERVPDHRGRLPGEGR